MADHTTRAMPGSVQGIVVQVADTRLELDCSQDDAVIHRAGKDLVLIIRDVIELTVEGFFNSTLIKENST